MVWTCTQCGTTAETDNPHLLRSMGWELTKPGEGVCGPCVKRNAATERPAPSRAERPQDVARRKVGDS